MLLLGTLGTAAAPESAPAGAFPLGTGEHRPALGQSHTCALLAGGEVRCWGFNGGGQLGTGTTASIGGAEPPAIGALVDLGPGRHAVAIAAGGFHTCAILGDANLLCWGGNGTGELGHGDAESIGDTESPGSHAPVFLGPGRTATAVVAGIGTTCALLDDGTVRCWGYGAAGTARGRPPRGPAEPRRARSGCASTSTRASDPRTGASAETCVGAFSSARSAPYAGSPKGWDPDSVTRIVLRTPAATLAPLIHHRPQTGLEAKFSIEYAAAADVLRESLGRAV